MDIIKQKQLITEWNNIKKIKYGMYSVLILSLLFLFLFLISQIQRYILQKKLFDFQWFIKILIFT